MNYARIWDFFFNRWVSKIDSQGDASFFHTRYGVNIPGSEFKKSYVIYKLTNKFDGSEKLIRKWLESPHGPQY